MDHEQRGRSGQRVALCVVDHGFVKGEGSSEENRELGEEMEKEEEGEC